MPPLPTLPMTDTDPTPASRGRHDAVTLNKRLLNFLGLDVMRRAHSSGYGVDITTIVRHPRLFLRLMECLLVILESLGGLLLTFAAQTGVSHTGPINVDGPEGSRLEIVLAVLGGAFLGIRCFTDIPRRISSYFIKRPRDRKEACDETLRLSGYAWRIAMQFAKSDQDIPHIILSILLNAMFANLIFWDWHAFLVSISTICALLIFLGILYRQTYVSLRKVARHQTGAPPTLFSFNDDYEYDWTELDWKHIEQNFAKRNPLWEILVMLSTMASITLAVALGLINKHQVLSPEDFSAYLQINAIPAIFNFIALVDALMQFISWTVNRARLDMIRGDKSLGGDPSTVLQHIVSFVNHETGLMPDFMAKHQGVNHDFTELLRAFQTSGGDGQGDGQASTSDANSSGSIHSIQVPQPAHIPRDDYGWTSALEQGRSTPDAHYLSCSLV